MKASSREYSATHANDQPWRVPGSDRGSAQEAFPREACVKSDHVRRAADRAAAQHDPVPQWAVDGVLTSPDALVPILESLELRHGTAG